MNADLLITYLIAAVTALGIAYVMVVPPGGGERLARGYRYHRAGGRHARRAPSALTTIPDVREFVRAA